MGEFCRCWFSPFFKNKEKQKLQKNPRKISKFPPCLVQVAEQNCCPKVSSNPLPTSSSQVGWSGPIWSLSLGNWGMSNVWETYISLLIMLHESLENVWKMNLKRILIIYIYTFIYSFVIFFSCWCSCSDWLGPQLPSSGTNFRQPSGSASGGPVWRLSGRWHLCQV